MFKDIDNARRIVRTQQIKLLTRDHPGNRCAAGLPRIDQRLRGPRHRRSHIVRLGVLIYLKAIQPKPDRVGKARVIHGRVQTIALQLRTAIKKILAQQISGRVLCFHGLSNPRPYFSFQLIFAVPRQHIGNIHAPTVHGIRRLQPITENRIRAAIDHLAQFSAAIIQLGQTAHTQPAFIIIWIRVKREILSGRRIGIFQRRCKPRMFHTAVIGHNIHDEAHAAFSGGTPQSDQRGIPAQMRINVVIVHNVITMIAISRKDRVEVNGVHAQVCQIIEALLHTLQVAAVKLDHRCGPAALRLTPFTRQRTHATIFKFICAHVACRVAIRKTIREDLIEDTVTHPRRSRVLCQQTKIFSIRRDMRMRAGAVVPPDAIRSENQKAIGRDGHTQLEAGSPPTTRGCGWSLFSLHLSKKLFAIGTRPEQNPLNGRMKRGT